MGKDNSTFQPETILSPSPPALFTTQRFALTEQLPDGGKAPLRTRRWATTLLQVSAGWNHALALTASGEIIGWGSAGSVPNGSGYQSISSGDRFSLAIRSDGTIAAWGDDTYGQVSNVPAGTFAEIIAGEQDAFALRTDGTIVGWGRDLWGQSTDTPTGNDFVSIAGGEAYHGIAMRSDGSLVAWGRDRWGDTDLPEPGNYTAISANQFGNLFLRADGTIVASGFRYLRHGRQRSDRLWLHCYRWGVQPQRRTAVGYGYSRASFFASSSNGHAWRSLAAPPSL